MDSSLTVRIPPELEALVDAFAEREGMDPDEIVCLALEQFFGGHAGVVSFSRASEAAFRRLWDNDSDALYDQWKELYGVRAG